MEMAIEVGVEILKYVLQLIENNRRLMSGNYAKIEELSKNLRLLKTFMIKYTEKHHKNIILTGLADEIRSLVHEVEDVVENYIFEESLYQNKGVFGKAIKVFPHLAKLGDVGEAIEKVSEKVKKVYNDNKEIGIPLLVTEDLGRFNAISDNEKPAGTQGGDRVIGFEDATDEVLELLGGKKLVQGKSQVEEQITSESEQHSESKQLEVVSIHGMLGLGKTTLARKVLNDPRIEYHFFSRIFVSVSNEYKKKEVLLSVLSVFIKNIRDQNLSVEELVAKVRETLTNKYLIVMDDVWTKEAWDDLKGAFPDKNNGSRVLITSRLKSVSMYAGTKTEPYKLRFMRTKEAEELLRMKVFKGKKFPEKLESVEARILAKCDGLPLAIVVTAGILRNDPENEKWWEDVLLGVNNFVGDDKERSDALIRLSYDNLPRRLKSCFLYLGVFPEDLEIKVSKLLQLWIAEGFVPQYEKASMDKIAEHFLGELVDRNLVMVGDRTLSGRIKTCRIHDTLRDFCKKTAKAEDFFQEFDMGTISFSTRRLCCINSNFRQFVSGNQTAENVRSFLSFGLAETILTRDLCPSAFKPFKLLRVLDMLSIKLGRFPPELRRFVLLKFFAICCEIKTFPNGMSSLLNLQTLIIHTTSSSLDIQANIWAMTKLRHLQTNTSTILPKCKEQSSSIEELQILSAVSPQSLTNEVFERIKKLKKLGIRGDLCTLVEANGESSLFDSLCKLNSLENLKLLNDGASEMLALPPPHKFPTRLTKLSLQNTRLDWSHMSTLGKLRYLEVLKLRDNAFKGDFWRTEEGGFRSLKVLLIGATNLKRWKAEANNFPELRCLILKHCIKLEGIPSDFADMKNLEMFNLECTNDSVVSSARRIVLLQLQMLRQRKDNETNPIKLVVYPPE